PRAHAPQGRVPADHLRDPVEDAGAALGRYRAVQEVAVGGPLALDLDGGGGADLRRPAADEPLQLAEVLVVALRHVRRLADVLQEPGAVALDEDGREAGGVAAAAAGGPDAADAVLDGYVGAEEADRIDGRLKGHPLLLGEGRGELLLDGGAAAEHLAVLV